MGPILSKNKPELAKDHKPGHGPWDCFVKDEPDNFALRRMVKAYIKHFRDNIFGGMPLKKAMETFSDKQTKVFYEKIGGPPDTIVGEVPGFDR